MDDIPRVTVLMPVFNGEEFLREAVESILDQTFEDFEFLIIDDGSTDDSVRIIESYGDPRIKLEKNKSNIGLAKSLNKGIRLSRGEYIARMDADDISMPQRLEKQIEYLDINHNVSALATKIYLINSRGEFDGYWDDDQNTLNYEGIKNLLPRVNCIAHPTVVVRRNIYKKYLYNELQHNSQDYDLWLRLVSDGEVLFKLNEELLLHRNHGCSITSSSNDKYGKLKYVFVKFKYIKYRLLCFRFNRFDCLVFKSFSFGLINYLMSFLFDRYCLLKSHLFFFLRLFFSRRRVPCVFLFFPYHHIGGAEKVHSRIVQCLDRYSLMVFFTHNSKQEGYLAEFQRYAKVFFIESLLKDSVLRKLFVKLLVGFINSSREAVVIGANCSLFYEVLPYFKDTVCCIDIIHGLGGGIEDGSLKYVQYLDVRVVVAEQIKIDLLHLYEKKNDSQVSFKKIKVIENYCEIPNSLVTKNFSGYLRLLYVGRGSPEKRLHLLGRIARLCHERGLSVELTFAGPDCDSFVEVGDWKFCRFIGEIKDFHNLSNLYRESHLFLLASEREGLPLALLDAMSHGSVPLVTAVGGVPQHVDSGVNGYLFDVDLEDGTLIESFVSTISMLNQDRDFLCKLSSVTTRYANKNFHKEVFCDSWTKLIVNRH